MGLVQEIFKLITGKINNDGKNSGAIIGTNSGSVVIQNGITEERVRAIINELAPQVMEHYTNESNEIGKVRIAKLEDEIMSRLEKLEGAIHIFGEPYFQRTLKLAETSAILNEDNHKYGMIAEVLLSNAQSVKNIKDRAVKTRAIEILPDIDEDSLCAITTIFILNDISCMDYNSINQLELFERHFEALVERLPSHSSDWIENLELLDCARVSTVCQRIDPVTLFTSKVGDSMCTGIKKNSNEYYRALKLLNEAGIQENLMVDNELLEGYVKLPINCQESIFEEELRYGTKLLSNQQKIKLKEIITLYSEEDEVKEASNKQMREKIEGCKNIMAVCKWYNSLGVGVKITKVGQIVSNANLSSLDNTIPMFY